MRRSLLTASLTAALLGTAGPALAGQAPRCNYLGLNYYRSPQVPW